MRIFKRALTIACASTILLSSTPVFASDITTEDLLARIEALEERVSALEGSGTIVSTEDTKTITPGLYVAGRDIETGRITITATSGELEWHLYENSEAQKNQTPIDWSYIKAADYDSSFNHSNSVTLGLEKDMVLSIREAGDDIVSTMTYTVEPFITEE